VEKKNSRPVLSAEITFPKIISACRTFVLFSTYFYSHFSLLKIKKYNNDFTSQTMANTNTNDIDSLLMDSDDDQLTEEIMRDKVTKESFRAMNESATTGGDFLNIVNLLPNSSQCYGHSLTMNAIIKIICRHSTFKDRCTGFYTTKVKAGKEMKVVSTYNMLNQINKELLHMMI
jgi:hypothetical protein